MTPLILALNVGSSSVKMAVFEDAPDQPLRVKGQVSGLRTQPRFALSAQGSDGAISRTLPAHTDGTEALEQLFDELAKMDLLERISLVGHRIVHGGADFIGPTLLDEEAMRSLHQLTSLAPLHQPFNLAAVEAAVRRLPDARQIGCFDTGFHATQPRIARLYALPRHLSDEGLISSAFMAFRTITLLRCWNSAGQRDALSLPIWEAGRACALCKADAAWPQRWGSALSMEFPWLHDAGPSIQA